MNAPKRCSVLVYLIACVGVVISNAPRAVGITAADLEQAFRSPPREAMPWTFWYWMKGRVSPAGITADLEAMKRAGIGGAYLMPIQGPDDPSQFEPAAEQLSPRFWQMVRHAASEANRLDLQLGVHACDGFAVAGGPWITPELSMQRLVWRRVDFAGGRKLQLQISKPKHFEGYYRDVAVLAFPSLPGANRSSQQQSPIVTTSDRDAQAARLSEAGNQQRYRSEVPCWIQFEFDEPFTCRGMTITPDGDNYQSQRMSVLASQDGEQFDPVTQLTPPRHGWQDEAAPATHAISATTARYFRFAWTPVGSEPGAEDLDAAKWAAVLKLNSIVLHSEPVISSYRGKNGSIWRQSAWTDSTSMLADECVPLEEIVDLSNNLTSNDQLEWNAPAGDWTLLRVGHTSTGKTNATGGGGMGLECDKLNPDAVHLQFDKWFGEFRRQMSAKIGPQATRRTLTTFHVDSWECGSQNWTPGFDRQFRRLRGYDLRRYLPCVAGIPVESVDQSERFLRDLRATIADLTTAAFFGTLRELTHEQAVTFSAECTAPTMTGDAMRHFALVDVPMGEFWLNSPTHDKPNDMRDAISAAHIYGKPIIQAEAFTELRIRWDETPHQLKPLGDRNLALGANRMVMHVFTHNPWLDRKPGQTLGGVGLYFQRDQPWLTASRGWMQYYARCGSVLQQGRPVADIAIWTGDDLPSRSLTPERLIDTLPGLIGEPRVARERQRLANTDQPQREKPKGVRASANIVDPADWTNTLGGYAYDSINSDAIMRLAKVEGGRIRVSDGASYELLVLPSNTPLMPRAGIITSEVADKLAEFVEQGGTVLCCEPLAAFPGLSDHGDKRVAAAVGRLEAHPHRFFQGPWEEPTLDALGIAPDLIVESVSDGDEKSIAWNHRAGDGWDAYFLSNQQQDLPLKGTLSLRCNRRAAEVWDPVTATITPLPADLTSDGRAHCEITLAAGQSVLLVFRDDKPALSTPKSPETISQSTLPGPWRLTFSSAIGDSPVDRKLSVLTDLSLDEELEVSHFAGDVRYETTFDWRPDDKRTWLAFDNVAPLAVVELNGHDCGVAWTAPWKVNITAALQSGTNDLVVRVPSTWKNRLVADAQLPDQDRRTWTSEPIRLPDQQLTPYGLMGSVRLISE